MEVSDDGVQTACVSNGNNRKIYFLFKTRKRREERIHSLFCIELEDSEICSTAYIDDLGGREEDNLRFFVAFSSSGTSPLMLKELWEEQ